MLILVAILILLGVVTGVMALVMHRKDRPEPPVVEQATCATCNGDNDKCEQECMMEAATQPIEYFEDEELDAFRGRPSDAYDDATVCRCALHHAPRRGGGLVQKPYLARHQLAQRLERRGGDDD